MIDTIDRCVSIVWHRLFGGRIYSCLCAVAPILSAFCILLSLIYLVSCLWELVSYIDAGLTDVLRQITFMVFLSERLLNASLHPRSFARKYKVIGHVLNALLLLLVLPVFSSGHVTVLLAILSGVELSQWLHKQYGRRINPSLVLSLSFFLLIVLGMLLLMAPASLRPTASLEITDALFVSTSSVCITGLSPVNIAEVFTKHGMFVIMMLIQIGGLGVMTLTSFFAMLMMGGTSVYNQLAVRDMVNGNSLSALLSTLVNIIVFTLLIECLGALFIYLSIGESLPQENALFFCVFHSVSAFCNAGFSTLPEGLSAPTMIVEQMNGFYFVISVLVILGGLGYPLMMNVRQALGYALNRAIGGHERTGYRQTHLMAVNTKMVAATTMFLLLAGTILIVLLEWNNAFSGLPATCKVTHAFFNAVCPRTAGFSSIPLTGFCFQSLLLYTLLMWVGGASQSTAGGIKINVFSIALKSFWCTLRGLPEVTLFGRTIPKVTVMRANATITVSLSCIFLSFFVLTWLEPGMSKQGLFFEVVSAISTVGSSLDITGHLHDAGKMLIVALMFCGRVGMFTILTSFIKQQPKGTILRCPEEQIIID